MEERVRLSPLGHTWLIDLDGTVLKHNGYLQGGDELLEGVCAFWSRIPADDHVILLTARDEVDRVATLDFLTAQGLRFDQAIFGLPVGERILINDAKPNGLVTALAVSVVRDAGLAGLEIEVAQEL
jgi:hypothetical protein